MINTHLLELLLSRTYFHSLVFEPLKFDYIYIIEPVSVKTGLNDIEMKIQITALRASINFSECFLKIERITISVNDVINVMQLCFDVSYITFVSKYFGAC